LIIACNFFRKALPFMEEAAICLERSAGFQRSTNSRGQPGRHDNINGNSISQCIPKPHTGGLIFDFLPISGKNEEGRDQSNRKTDKDGCPGSKTPGHLILDYIHCNTVNPAQDNAKKNANEHLYFCVGILLLSCQPETDRVIEAE